VTEACNTPPRVVSALRASGTVWQDSFVVNGFTVHVVEFRGGPARYHVQVDTPHITPGSCWVFNGDDLVLVWRDVRAKTAEMRAGLAA